MGLVLLLRVLNRSLRHWCLHSCPCKCPCSAATRKTWIWYEEKKKLHLFQPHEGLLTLLHLMHFFPAHNP